MESKLTASDAAAGDAFGNSVAVSGDRMVVGANADDDSGDESGSAYVFVRSGGVWSQDAKLTASDGTAGDDFGYSVAISGTTVVIGAPLSGNATGSAYVFVRTDSGWVQQAKLTALDGDDEDQFGASVAVTGPLVAIGAKFDDGPASASGRARRVRVVAASEVDC